MTDTISQIVILSGGRGRRLLPFTKLIPKSLVKIGGKPFVAYQLELLRKKGITKAVICTGHHGGQIRNYVKDGSYFGLSVDYSFDGRRLLGTAGALLKALPLLDNVFFVTYGDSYLDINFHHIAEYFFSEKKKALMTIYENRNKYDRSNIVYKDDKIIQYDKCRFSPDMSYIDYGLMIFEKNALRYLDAKRPADLSDLCKTLIGRGEMAAYKVKKRFYEIGSLEGMEEMKKYLLKGRRRKI